MTALLAARRRSDTSSTTGGAAELPLDLVRVRSALTAGLSPAEALTTARHPALRRMAGQLRLGRRVATLVDDDLVAEGNGVHLLVQALAVAESAGGGGGVATDQALDAIRETHATDRLLAVKTAQARGTATLMAAVPAVAWLALVLLDPAAVRFYTTVPGIVTGGLAVVCMATGRWWSRRLVARAGAAPDRTDPLQPVPGRPAWRRGAAGGALAGVAAAVMAGPTVAVVVAVVAAALLARPRSSAQIDLGSGGTPELTELIGLGVTAGLSLPAAVLLVARLGPVAARDHLSSAGRLLQSGRSPAESFAGTPLTVLGELLSAAERFGAPAASTLREYAAELRAGRRIAAEEAAERTQLALVFPTTLLILPGFALAVVPPLVWIGFVS